MTFLTFPECHTMTRHAWTSRLQQSNLTYSALKGPLPEPVGAGEVGPGLCIFVDGDDCTAELVGTGLCADV
jgi:hypothetical protein